MGDVWIGAAIGATLISLLFTVGKFLIGLYSGSSGVSSTYGAAGSLISADTEKRESPPPDR
jgi:membrane protein